MPTRYTFTHEGRTYSTVAGPATATDSFTPDYPREMMATHSACRICWRDIENGEVVHELDTGHAVHHDCVEWAVFAIKTEAPQLAPQRRDIPAGPWSPWPRAEDIGRFRVRMRVQARDIPEIKARLDNLRTSIDSIREAGR